MFSYKYSHFLDGATLHTLFCDCLHLTISTSPSTASSNLTASHWTSLLNPSSIALQSSLLYRSSLSLPQASSSLAASPRSPVSTSPFLPHHLHLAVHTLASSHCPPPCKNIPDFKCPSLKQEVVPINLLVPDIHPLWQSLSIVTLIYLKWQ